MIRRPGITLGRLGPDGIGRHWSLELVRRVQNADVLVLDAVSDWEGWPDWPGAVRIAVQSSQDAVHNVLAEALSGSKVVRLVRHDRWEATLAEEIPTFYEQGLSVEVMAAVRPEDVILATWGLGTENLAYWPGKTLASSEAVWLLPQDGPSLATALIRQGNRRDRPIWLLTSDGQVLAGPVPLQDLDWPDRVDPVLLLMSEKARPPEHRALLGKRVLTLRASTQQEPLQQALEDLGAIPIAAPLLAISNPQWSAVDACLRSVGRYDWLVFTSQNGVAAFFDRLRYLKQDVRTIRGRIAAVGPQTQSRLEDLCLRVDLVPEGDLRQEGLLAAFRNLGVRGKSVLMAVGNRRRLELANGLREMGALVDEAIVYRTEPRPLPEWVDHAIRSRRIDAVVFLSGSSAEFLVKSLSGEAMAILATCHLISIGPSTSKVLRKLGLSVSAEAATPDVGALMTALAGSFGDGQPKTITHRPQ